MAGNYPDAPSRRMAWDADGSVGLIRNVGDRNAEWSGADKTELNDEDNISVSLPTGAGGSADHFVYVIFPELREVEGFFAKAQNSDGFNAIGQVAFSGDTTNGIDGTWTEALADYNDQQTPAGSVVDFWRTQITSLALSNVRGVRVRRNHNSALIMSSQLLRAIHLYGRPSLGETPDRLRFIDEGTGSEFTKPKDYGDIPRGSTRDFQFRLRNNSTTLTANDVQVTAEDLFLGSGAWYTFDVGGGFQATISILSIAPGADSPVITCRQVVPVDALPHAHAGRVRATVASWS